MATQPELATSARGPASDQDRILAHVRQGLAISLFVLAALFLGTALYPVLRGLPFREGWPWIIWGGLLALATLAGGGMLFRRPAATGELQHLRNLTAVMLLVLSAGFAAIPVYAVSRSPLAVAVSPVVLWAGAVSVICLSMGLISLATAEGRRGDLERYRLSLLSVGGLAGFVTALLGCILPVTTYQYELMGGLESWRSQPGAILFPGARSWAGCCSCLSVCNWPVAWSAPMPPCAGWCTATTPS